MIDRHNQRYRMITQGGLASWPWRWIERNAGPAGIWETWIPSAPSSHRTVAVLSPNGIPTVCPFPGRLLPNGLSGRRDRPSIQLAPARGETSTAASSVWRSSHTSGSCNWSRILALLGNRNAGGRLSLRSGDDPRPRTLWLRRRRRLFSTPAGKTRT
jgi:hypothetical protein